MGDQDSDAFDVNFTTIMLVSIIFIAIIVVLLHGSQHVNR